MAQNYECVLLLDPTLSEENVESYQQQFSQIVTDAGGEVTREQKWGKRRLRYRIAHNREAHYLFICFQMGQGAGAVVEEFERRVRINDELLREMTVKVDKLRTMDPPPMDVVLGRPSPRARGGGYRSGGDRRPPPGGARPPRAAEAPAKESAAASDKPDATAEATAEESAAAPDKPDATAEATAEESAATPDKPDAAAEAPPPESAPQQEQPKEDEAETTNDSPEKKPGDEE